MPPTNANPGAGGARAHGISKSDAASLSRNQHPAQSNPAARSAEFILAEAANLGIKVGTDGDELVMLGPVRVPDALQKWFATKLEEFRDEVIDIIQRENAGGAS
jgi:hypothetical protein